MKSTGKGLRQEDSEPVWNKLFQYKPVGGRMGYFAGQVHEEVEEPYHIAELRACLQREKDGKTPSSWFLRVTHHCDVHAMCVVNQERVRSSQELVL